MNVRGSSQSEVARIRQQIATATEAMRRGFFDFASVARHETITAGMERLAPYCTQLQEVLGEAQGTELFLQCYDEALTTAHLASQRGCLAVFHEGEGEMQQNQLNDNGTDVEGKEG